MKDFLWITVYSGKWPARSLNLSITRNKWCWGLCILWNKSSSAFWSNSETLRLYHPNFFKRLNIASTFSISSADMNPPQAGRAYTMRNTMREYATLSLSGGVPWCCNSFRRYIRWEHCDIKKCTRESIFRLSWNNTPRSLTLTQLSCSIASIAQMWTFETLGRLNIIIHGEHVVQSAWILFWLWMYVSNVCMFVCLYVC